MLSNYPRKLKKDDAKNLGYENNKLMGYSIRTDKYRYTIWFNNDFRSTQAYNASRIYASELYDYVKDPLEKVNYAGDKSYAKIEGELKSRILEYLKSYEGK